MMNFNKLEPMFVISAHNILKLPALKRIQNFPSHLNFVATLPDNNSATEWEAVFLCKAGY